jgi:hypothetical protein
MKIEQIIEGRAEDIDKAIAALRAEKAALRGSGYQHDDSGVEDTPIGVSLTGNREVTAVDDFSASSGGRGGRETRAVDDFSDMPSGPPGRNYATPKPMTAAEKAKAYRDKMHAIPDKQSQQILNTEKSKRQSAQALAYDRAQSKERSDRIVNTEKSKRQTAQSGAFDTLMKNAGVNRKQASLMQKPIGGGTAKRGDDNYEWYNNPGTKMQADTAKYADTGEAPEIKKPAGNLPKWIKANATKRKEFDQDMANK